MVEFEENQTEDFSFHEDVTGKWITKTMAVENFNDRVHHKKKSIPSNLEYEIELKKKLPSNQKETHSLKPAKNPGELSIQTNPRDKEQSLNYATLMFQGFQFLAYIQ